jgi:deazaflavin-dependent oxidoreductase (nitroreductase family)
MHLRRDIGLVNERSMTMVESSPYQQITSGPMTYPNRGSLNRLMFKTPLIWWRSGLGSILGRSMLVLTTWGRKSHHPRHTMLSYTPMQDCIYIEAGWGEGCDWYQNLQADPHVTLQVWSEQVTRQKGEVVIPILARRVTDEAEFRAVAGRLFETGGDSHFKPWLRSLGIDYDFDDLAAKRERVHQVALDLQPIDLNRKALPDGYPPPMETDLKWVWAVMAVSFWLGWLAGRGRR